MQPELVPRNGIANLFTSGSCLDGLSGEIGKDPTNVIRFSRALNPYAIVNDEKVSQIVHYIPGVGTQSGSFLRGGKSSNLNFHEKTS